MSMLLMVQAMKLKVGNPLRKLVLIKLADNANDQGECWPSYQHVADQCEISKSTVRKHIKDLESAGLLRIEHRDGPKGNSSNLYHLSLHPVPSESIGMPSESIPPVPSDDTRTSHSLEPVKEPVNGSAEPKEKRACQLPKDFEPNKNNIEVAKDLGVDLNYQVEQFKDWHLAKGSKYKNWNFALNTWMRKSAEFSSGNRFNQSANPAQQQRVINDL